jgi:hypothetical protein
LIEQNVPYSPLGPDTKEPDPDRFGLGDVGIQTSLDHHPLQEEKEPDQNQFQEILKLQELRQQFEIRLEKHKELDAQLQQEADKFREMLKQDQQRLDEQSARNKERAEQTQALLL